MPEHWIDDALPEHDPTDDFVATLRDDLQRGWRGEQRRVATATTPSPPTSRAPRRRWATIAAAAGIAAAAVVAVAVVADNDPGSITSGTTPDSVDTSVPAVETAPAPTATSLPVPTTIDPSLGVAPLTGTTWVRMPTSDPYGPLLSEPRLEFDSNGAVRGWDGCQGWTDVVDVENGVITYRSGAAVRGYCSTQQREGLHGATFAIANDGGVPRLTITPQDFLPPATYVDSARLAVATGTDLTGAWLTAAGIRLTFDANGDASLGPCPPSATWTLDGGSMHIVGSPEASEQIAACGGGTGWLSATGTETSWDGVALRDGDRVLLVGGPGRDDWLTAAGPEPALDLSRASIHGFRAGMNLESDFVIDVMAGIVGEPTFDSGWYVTERREVTDGEDCYGGLPMRVVIWGDIAFGWLKLNTADSGTERLWITSVGDWSPLLAMTRLDVAPPAGPSQFTATDDGLGVGSTLDELSAAGLDVSVISATEATISPGAGAYTVVNFQDGVVTSIVSQNPGFC